MLFKTSGFFKDLQHDQPGVYEASGQFLLLGSASGMLLHQSSESLAGRVAQLELTPFQAREVLAPNATDADLNTLWLRGGFPLSWLASSARRSLRWREEFITTYLEQDLPALGPRIPATTLRRLWTMLAHSQGELLDQSRLASALAMDKAKSKAVMAAAGVVVPGGGLFNRFTAAREHVMPPPYVVKPNAEGSSVGVFLVFEGANSPPQELVA